MYIFEALGTVFIPVPMDSDFDQTDKKFLSICILLLFGNMIMDFSWDQNQFEHIDTNLCHHFL